MVNGSVLKFMADYVEEKKGITGKAEFQRKVNEKNVIIPNLDSIDPDDEFSVGYFERVFNASAKVLNDEKLVSQFGFNYGKKFSSPSIRLFSFLEKNERIVDTVCNNLKKYIPTLSVSYDSLSDKKFVIKINNIKTKEESLFVSGYLEAIFKKIQKKNVKTEEDLGDQKKIVIRFL